MMARDNSLDGGYQWTAKYDGFEDEVFIYFYQIKVVVVAVGGSLLM